MTASDLELHAKRRIGTVLRGKYRLEHLLGVGGMAVVYKATHRNQAEFAVKMLHPELSIREDVRTRFLREGYAANSVKHPGAVLVVDDDVAEDGAAFLVMELLDGVEVETLWERGGGRMGPLEASSIVVQLLDVLGAAHAKGIVHRDIKPANLFVTRDGTVKVLDFGIARARDAAASGANSTGSGLLLGTPAYMPPEQALAQSERIDGQTDLWAAGATLFTLISGHYVHEGENGSQLMIRAATTHARPIAALAPDAPPAIGQVVDRALAFDKAARWPTAAAMRAALDTACRESFRQAPSKAVLAAAFGNAEVGHAATARPPAVSDVESAPTVGSEQTPYARGISASRPMTPMVPVIPMTGGTTAQPISGEPIGSVPGVRRTNPLVLAILALCALIAAGGLFALGRGEATSAGAPVQPAAGLVVPAAAALPSETAPAPPLASAPAATIARPATAPPPFLPKRSTGPSPSRSLSPPPSQPQPPPPPSPPPVAESPKPPPAPTPPNAANDNPLDLPMK